MALIDELLPKVKANLILEHNQDDNLLEGYIKAAVSYAESYQHLSEGYYAESSMLPTTEQAVIMLSGHFYESRMARQPAFSQTMFRRVSRFGMQ